MTEPEYRQDDRTDTGYCPKCGEPVSTVFVDGGGWCPDHGRVWCDWTPRTASGRDENDPATGRCARCGHWWDDHPSGWCPDQISPDGTVNVETVQAFEPRDSDNHKEDAR